MNISKSKLKSKLLELLRLKEKDGITPAIAIWEIAIKVKNRDKEIRKFYDNTIW